MRVYTFCIKYRNFYIIIQTRHPVDWKWTDPKRRREESTRHKLVKVFGFSFMYYFSYDSFRLGSCLWATMWENVPSYIYVQRRLNQSDQSLHCPHEETLLPWLSKMLAVKILIRLRECAVWSESSLGAHVRRYISWRFGSNILFCRTASSMHWSYITCYGLGFRDILPYVHTQLYGRYDGLV